MRTRIVGAMFLSMLGACASAPDANLKPVALVSKVDLPRFMGDWYVIANIPTMLEKGAHDAKEHYALDADGRIATTFTFRADAFDGPAKRYTSTGAVVEGSGNAVWTEQYIWPFKADYRISYLSDDYTETVIARDKRDYVWIMARTPTIPDADLDRLTAFVGRQGYDVSKLQRVPQASGR
jgi:apolipoprotein D and lipocalin family protein